MKIAANVVYIPHVGDADQDHQVTARAAEIVFGPARLVRTPECVYAYEVPSSTDQTLLEPCRPFVPNAYVAASAYHAAAKIKAFRSYDGAGRDFPHPCSEKALRVLSAKRGTECNCHHAEAFMMLRSVEGQDDE